MLLRAYLQEPLWRALTMLVLSERAFCCSAIALREWDMLWRDDTGLYGSMY